MSTHDKVFQDSTGLEIAESLTRLADVLGAPTTFEEVRTNVYKGLGSKLYPVGFKFPVTHSVYGNMKYVVTGHDQIAAANGNPHTMTLVPQVEIANLQYDAPELTQYCASGLAVGTYNFIYNGTSYQFTTTKAIPAGGGWEIAWRLWDGGAITDKGINTYSSRTSSTVLETTANVVAGSSGTSLGTVGSGTLNHIHRSSYGSNNYKESAIRRLINSSEPAGSVWAPQTQFDLPPSWASSVAGFKAGLPEDFLSVVATAVVECSTNNTYEAPDSTTPKNTKYELYDDFFLPSVIEVFGTNYDVADNSKLMSYYNGASNYDRIKLNTSGSPYYWWLRTPNSGYAHDVRFVNTDGSLNNYNAYNSYGCVPACIIA